MTMITNADVAQYVRDTLPYDELTDWDIDAIVADMIAAWPLIGEHDGEPCLHLGPNRIIEHLIDDVEYWAIVKERQR